MRLDSYLFFSHSFLSVRSPLARNQNTLKLCPESTSTHKMHEKKEKCKNSIYLREKKGILEYVKDDEG